MNKTFKKLMVLALAGMTLCTTAVAAPRGNKGRAPNPAPRHQTVKNPPAPKHHAPKHHPAPPPAPHCRPKAHHGHHEKGWVTFGAAVVGGLVGGLLGACR